MKKEIKKIIGICLLLSISTMSAADYLTYSEKVKFIKERIERINTNAKSCIFTQKREVRYGVIAYHVLCGGENALSWSLDDGDRDLLESEILNAIVSKGFDVKGVLDNKIILTRWNSKIR